MSILFVIIAAHVSVLTGVYITSTLYYTRAL